MWYYYLSRIATYEDWSSKSIEESRERFPMNHFTVHIDTKVLESHLHLWKIQTNSIQPYKTYQKEKSKKTTKQNFISKMRFSKIVLKHD